MIAALADKGRLLLHLLRSEGVRSVTARVIFACRRQLENRSRVTLHFGDVPPLPSNGAGEIERVVVPGSGTLESQRRAIEMLEAELPAATARGVLHLTSSDPSHPRGGADWHVAELRAGLHALAWSSVVVWAESRTLKTLWGSSPERLWVFGLPTEPRERARRQQLILGYLARALSCQVVHAHDLRSFERSALLQLGLPLVISLHDFQLYCRRPHLMESTTSSFCDYSRDQERCRRCLEAAGLPQETVAAAAQERWRREAAALIDRASALVAPSGFMANAIGDLFGDRHVRRKVHVIENETASAQRRDAGGNAGTRAPVRVVFVGQFTRSKGSALFAEIVRGLAADSRFDFRVVGGIVDHESLRSARSAGRVETTGWYRRERLPDLLDADSDVVAFVSVVPESWSYTLTEVLTLGTPVVALDLGAVGERLRRIGREDWLVSRDEGAGGFVRRLHDHVEGRLVWPAGPWESPWSSKQMTAQHAELYEECLKRQSREAGPTVAGTLG
ncbi:MAG TPA: glycosyltransferase family 4 protein [Thermoanaerobaculia bacterium]|nr:glycosyltransferase family 4 protein [Thermoanaerobaculia bacterium]